MGDPESETASLPLFAASPPDVHGGAEARRDGGLSRERGSSRDGGVRLLTC